ncbi:BON domain protein [Bordetella holmesii CDC-H635-BH]|uniref:BON domain protein n=2 Tax=Bordetella holmesii TaxID=35814 RepID=A0A158M6P8_9BORD|nr:BON domain protein [Bordetella holmesii CDC-H572-BH]KAK84623.1 BON domain protein [Bordetella holmesii CDC-H809-BH]KAK88601.1 BON domain protein [Bordetella holmesii H620]KAK89347.1 BON domain protein [Bordetella holmesii CDC-H635-BH]KAK96174.1 BON domain protein [Bordetella holmesii CDC-H585-BH]KCV03435.1 BON domain protein [Bordetella holmesii CDC-H629-BH]KCV05753.1 BON domain protein [Bordetella holmesii CDC-H719-BH]KCV08323.1 BON domain protein [Bordetella holmesii 04P3421]KCV12668.1
MMMPNAQRAARPLVLALALATACASLTACIPLVVGGAAASTAVVATDRRTSGTQLDDQNINFRVERQISQKLGEAARVNAMVYNGQVLLTGDVPTEADKAQATTIAQGIEKVKSVSNQLTVGPAAAFSTRSNDTWLTSKVRTALINAQYVPSRTIAVTTDKGVVYLMGMVTQSEGDYAANAVASVGGVTKVVKLFDIISREEAVRLSNNNNAKDAPIETGASSSQDGAASGASTSGSSANTEGGIELMPIK